MANRFYAEIKRFTRIVETRSVMVFREAAYSFIKEVVRETPVWFTHEPDAGVAKGNWMASLTKPSPSYDESKKDKGPMGRKTLSGIKSVIDSVKKSGEMRIYFANFVPYITVLEYGGYPIPVKKGSWNSRTNDYEIRSEGGFSKQAPRGMVRINLQEWNKYVKMANQKVKAIK